MTALVACETVLLVLLTVLVAGLLRSHAEILRRLGPPDDEPRPAAMTDAPADAPAAADVAGVTLDGDAAKFSLAAADAPPALLAFLSSGCGFCGEFFAGLSGGAAAPLPSGLRLVVIAKDATYESPSRLRALASGTPVVLSSRAWSDYRVPASPYFVLAAGGSVRGEGSATGWQQLASLIGDALGDAGEVGRNGGDARARRAEAALAAAGIEPGHASLYPASGNGEGEA